MVEQKFIPRDDWMEFVELARELRPELHRYCARLLGSVIDGEDVVQDTLIKAYMSIRDLNEIPVLRPWLFRIAHNSAIDLLRSRRLRMSEPLEEALDIVDLNNIDPLEKLMSDESLKLSLSHFIELPVAQRSVVILKDVLGESLADIAALLDTSVDSVKSYLARGRAQLRQNNNSASLNTKQKFTSPAVAHYVELFNQRNWDALRALLSADVKLKQSSHPLRVGAEDVGMFFTIYAKSESVRLVPAWLDNREVIAVFSEKSDAKPSHIMWLEWRDDHISYIHDYRYVDYLLKDAELRIETSEN